MVIDTLNNWKLHVTSPLLGQAFEWLSLPSTLALPYGKHDLAPDRVFALPQGYETKAISEGRLEAHRRYIDIQMIVEGCERMGWAPLAGLPEDVPFDVDSDLGFYTGPCDWVTVRAGSFTIFYPHDAHMPCIHPVEGATQVRKIVVKVAVETL
jgi:YhcH/YjgK/YiaL family protein